MRKDYPYPGLYFYITAIFRPWCFYSLFLFCVIAKKLILQKSQVGLTVFGRYCRKVAPDLWESIGIWSQKTIGQLQRHWVFPEPLRVNWNMFRIDKFTALHQYFLPGGKKKSKKWVGHKIHIILNCFYKRLFFVIYHKICGLLIKG